MKPTDSGVAPGLNLEDRTEGRNPQTSIRPGPEVGLALRHRRAWGTEFEARDWGCLFWVQAEPCQDRERPLTAGLKGRTRPPRWTGRQGKSLP